MNAINTIKIGTDKKCNSLFGRKHSKCLQRKENSFKIMKIYLKQYNNKHTNFNHTERQQETL